MEWTSIEDDKPSNIWVFCWMPSQNDFTKGYLLNGKWDLQNFSNHIKVTHWMPLPEPPK